MSEALLKLFEASEGRYLSGEQISRELKVSRTAIWKQIQALKEEGYTFEAAPRLGYRMTARPDRLQAADIVRHLRTARLGRSIHLFEEVDSTQNVAQRLLREGAPEGTLVIAERQTSGRGRLGRQWFSPKGKGIYMSLVVKPDLPLHLIPHMTLLAAVALSRAIRASVPGVHPGIKWPNDLLIDGKKISGILMESTAENEALSSIIAGIGISCNLEVDDYPAELRDKATSLYIASGSKVDRGLLVAELMAELESLFALYREMGFGPIRTLWEASSVTLGRQVRMTAPNGVFEGEAVALDDWGGLVLRLPDGSLQTVYSADTELKREP